MKTKPIVLAALVLTAVVVEGEFVVAADHVDRAVVTWSARVRSYVTSAGVATVVKTIVRALACAPKS